MHEPLQKPISQIASSIGTKYWRYPKRVTITLKNNDYPKIKRLPIKITIRRLLGHSRWADHALKQKKPFSFAGDLQENGQIVMRTPCFRYKSNIKEKLRMEPLYQWFHTEMVRVARLELAASWSQTRRPTNWATPGYEVKEKLAKWSNMWSRKFYHSFAQLSTEVIRGNWGVTGQLPTFGAIEPVWCSSSQMWRPTNWAIPGYKV